MSRDRSYANLDAFSMALPVYPIAQFAYMYHLYVQYHAPATRSSADLVMITAALSFAPGCVFDPYAAFTPFAIAYATALIEGPYQILFDDTTCYTKIVKAMSRVKSEAIEIYVRVDDKLPPKHGKAPGGGRK